MIKIPEEFRDIPEAVALRAAQARFEAALQEERRLTQGSYERVHLISGGLRQAPEELQRAEAAFDAAAGLPKSPGLTRAAVEEAAKHFPSDQCQQVLELLERKCGRTIPFRREATAQELEWTRLAVLRLSKGNLLELKSWVDLANLDERSVEYAALPLMQDHPQT